MAGIIYLLCTLTALVCAWLLLGAYLRQRSSILLWGGLCFVGFFINNLLLVFDRIIFLNADLSTLRLLAGLVSLSLLLYGLIWEEEKI